MRVRKGKIVIFSLWIVGLLAIMGGTTKWVVDNLTLGLDLRGGFEVLYKAAPLEKGQKITPATLSDTADALNKRINSIGVTEPEISVEGKDRLRVSLAGVKDPDQARKLLGKPAVLEFRDPSGKKVLLKGSDLVQGAAKQDYNPQNNEPVVSVEFKDAEKYANITGKYVGQKMPIYLDDKQLSNPIIQERIPNGKSMISGNFTVEKAKELADLLNAGSLPVKLKQLSSNAVDASLGQDSLHKSLFAGLYAIGFIFLFVIGYYRLPGLIAVMTLISYSYLVLLFFSLLDVTLTLPGIAAYILGIGIAVDANIIMYERIKDELRSGKSIPISVKSGSKSSFLTIFDAHVTTIIASAVMFYFGTSGVRGFSVSLLVGIFVSFLTAVALSRILLTLLVRSNLLHKKHSWFGVKEDEISEL
ncbi:SecD/SecF fusion protein [Marininema mesophilum]|uniref:Protein translocase subunit SecD n=1 Tax=Marininema mesophilum TaxID=1048340 RepID=A0A1H2SBX1_9BACL|nr:protein translocase subunit SecD [Marininema mesophilum]SDW29075.1 SecD/SecF fusion protein [Marininema mesophilum]